MTRSHAERISKRLGQLSGDPKATELAIAIDTAYEDSKRAEITHDAASIDPATAKLREALLSGRAYLESKGAYVKTNADEYAERELGLEEDEKQRSEARQAQKRSTKLKKKFDKYEEVNNKTGPLYETANNLFAEGEYKEALEKFSEYTKELEVEYDNAATEKALEVKNSALNELDSLYVHRQENAVKNSIKEAEEYIEKGDKLLKEGKYEEAIKAYNDAESTINLSPLNSATIYETSPENVDRNTLLNKLSKKFTEVLASNPVSSNAIPDGLKTAMQNGYDQIATTKSEKLALADSSVSKGIIVEKRNGHKQLLRISATFLRNGSVQLNLSEVKNYSANGDINEEVKKQNTVNLANEVAVEKTPETIQEDLQKIIDDEINKFKSTPGTMASDLEVSLKRLLVDYVNQLTTDEKGSLGVFSRNGEFRATSGFRMGYDWHVTIRNGNVSVDVD